MLTASPSQLKGGSMHMALCALANHCQMQVATCLNSPIDASARAGSICSLRCSRPVCAVRSGLIISMLCVYVSDLTPGSELVYWISIVRTLTSRRWQIVMKCSGVWAAPHVFAAFSIIASVSSCVGITELISFDMYCFCIRQPSPKGEGSPLDS